MKMGRVCIGHSYVVDLENKEMVEDAKNALYEDIMNFVKYDEIGNSIDVVEDPTATADEIPEFLRENMEDWVEEGMEGADWDGEEEDDS